MRFSIITITLNADRFIAQTLDTVARQSCKDYEHIVWDGGSSDNTLDIISKYPHVRLCCGKDSGISDAMNKGAQFAKGDYLIHLHADDCLANDSVLKDIDLFLRENNDPQWVYGRANIIDEYGTLKRTSELVQFDPKRLRKYNIITHPAVILSRMLFMEQGGFRTDLRYCMDYEFWLRLARKKYSAVATPIVVANFRGHMGSLSTRESLAVANEAYKVRNEYVENIWERIRSYRTWKSRCKRLK